MDDQDVEIAEWVSEIEEYMGIANSVLNPIALMYNQSYEKHK